MSVHPYRILAVDDLPDNLYLLQTILEIEGYVVDVATNGIQALNQIKESSPDLVLLDIMMPGMNGIEVVQRLRRDDKTSDLPVLLLTAHPEVKANAEWANQVTGLLHKPIDFEELIDSVRSALLGEGQAASSHQTARLSA